MDGAKGATGARGIPGKKGLNVSEDERISSYSTLLTTTIYVLFVN